MREQSRAHLDAILKRYEQNHAASGAVPEEVSRSEVQFAVAFERVREEVILPALREFAAVLETRGHRCELVEEESPGHHSELAMTGLRLYPPVVKGAPVSEYPSLTFFPDPLSEKVLVTLCNPGASPARPGGDRVEYRLDQVTAAVVEAQVLKLLEEVFSG